MIKFLRVTGESEVALRFTAKPGQKKEGLSLDAQGNLVVRVNAPAVEGKANSRLIAFLSVLFGCPRKDITLSRGETSKHKEVRIRGVPLESLERALIRKVPLAGDFPS